MSFSNGALDMCKLKMLGYGLMAYAGYHVYLMCDYMQRDFKSEEARGSAGPRKAAGSSQRRQGTAANGARKTAKQH